MMFRPSMKVCMNEHSIHLRPPPPSAALVLDRFEKTVHQPEEAAWLLANTGFCQLEQRWGVPEHGAGLEEHLQEGERVGPRPATRQHPSKKKAAPFGGVREPV